MTIAVISDLHLGSGGKADAFGHDDAEFLRFLGFLERNFERIVLLGDIWETLTPVLASSPARELARARAHHPEIAARFRRPKYVYVHGNHDEVARTVEGAPEEIAVRVSGMRILFTHGHQNDRLALEHPWLAELGIWLGGWIRRFGLDAVYRVFCRLDGFLGGAHPEAARCRFQRWAVEQARRREFDVVVTGHTHLAARAEHGAKLFLNSGSCSDGAVSFLSLDPRRGTFAVHHAW